MNHIDEYDDLTAAEIIDHLSENSYSTDELRAIKTYEHENKDRITVRRTIDKMLVSDTDVGDGVDDDEDTEDDEAARTVELDTESMSTNEPDPDPDDGAARDGEANRSEDLSPQVDDTEGPDEDPEFVRVRLGRSGYAAGHSFDDAREVKEVQFNRRVQLAIERGTLRRV